MWRDKFKLIGNQFKRKQHKALSDTQVVQIYLNCSEVWFNPSNLCRQGHWRTSLKIPCTYMALHSKHCALLQCSWTSPVLVVPVGWLCSNAIDCIVSQQTWLLQHILVLFCFKIKCSETAGSPNSSRRSSTFCLAVWLLDSFGTEGVHWLVVVLTAYLSVLNRSDMKYHQLSYSSFGL